MTKNLFWGLSLFSLTILILFQNCSGTSDNLGKFQQSNASTSSSSTPTDEESNTVSSSNNSGSNYTFPGRASSFFSAPTNNTSSGSGSSTSNTSTGTATVTPTPPANSSQLSADSLAIIAPGASCGYVKSLAGRGYQQLLNDFAAAFDGSYLKVGETLNWASGVLKRNADGSLSYSDPKDSSNNFTMRKTDSPSRIAQEHFNVQLHWIRQYGVRFGQTQTQIWGAAAALRHLFGYPMDANKSFPLGFLNISVSTDAKPGNYTFHTPDGAMSAVQFLGSNWCLAMTSDWGQCEK